MTWFCHKSFLEPINVNCAHEMNTVLLIECIKSIHTRDPGMSKFRISDQVLSHWPLIYGAISCQIMDHCALKFHSCQIYILIRLVSCSKPRSYGKGRTLLITGRYGNTSLRSNGHWAFFVCFVVMHGPGDPRIGTRSRQDNHAVLSCSYTPPVNFSSFLRWRPQTGSSFPQWFLVWQMWFLEGWRLSEGGPVCFSSWTHQGLVWKTTSGQLPPPWKTLAIN